MCTPGLAFVSSIFLPGTWVGQRVPQSISLSFSMLFSYCQLRSLFHTVSHFFQVPQHEESLKFPKPETWSSRSSNNFEETWGPTIWAKSSASLAHWPKPLPSRRLSDVLQRLGLNKSVENYDVLCSYAFAAAGSRKLLEALSTLQAKLRNETPTDHI